MLNRVRRYGYDKIVLTFEDARDVDAFLDPLVECEPERRSGITIEDENGRRIQALAGDMRVLLLTDADADILATTLDLWRDGPVGDYPNRADYKVAEAAANALRGRRSFLPGATA